MNTFIVVPFRFRNILCLTFILLTVASTAVLSQRRGYSRMAYRANQTGIYLSTLILPGEPDNMVLLTIPFRLNYGLLTFKRLNDSGNDAEFYASASLNLKIYKSPEPNLRTGDQVSIVDLESVANTSWRDTAYASGYEETKSQSRFLTGSLQVALPPGHYTYIIQLNRNSSERQTSSNQHIHIPEYASNPNGEIILAEEAQTDNFPTQLNLVNRGNNVLYGEDFSAFIQLPAYDTGISYQIEVSRIRINRNDTTHIETIFQQPIARQQIHTGTLPVLKETDGQLFLTLNKNANGYTYALVQIPNHKFPNETYKIEVIENETQQAVAQKVYHSLWTDMPVSLHNLDMAIEMLRFIADEATREQIEEGSGRERKEKFDAFWKKRDPTPETEFNELMAEYYRRIDYTFEHYSSQRTPGFETDRGRIYILYGPPDNIDRVFPPEGYTREIWTYDNRRFVFEATSGFGDFKLISNQ